MIELFIFEKDMLNPGFALTEALSFTVKSTFLVKGNYAEYGFVNNPEVSTTYFTLPYDSNVLLSEAVPAKFRVNPARCIVIGKSKKVLDLAHQSGMPIILFNINREHRTQYQKHYNPIYICDSEEELLILMKLYGKAALPDILAINKDLAQPIIDAKELRPVEQEELGKMLFPVYQIMMQGRNLESFTSQFKDNKPSFIEVMIYVNNMGKPVGFVIASGHEISYPLDAADDGNSADKYMIYEVLVCMLPETQNNRYIENGLLMLFDEYHIKNPNINVMIFDSMVNYRSYKIALRSRTSVEASAFPRPGRNTNFRVEGLIQYLKNYFNYMPVGNDPYTVRTISDTRVKECPSNQDDVLWKFYSSKTGDRPNVGLLTLSCFYAAENNSLGLPAQSQFFYDKNFGDEECKCSSKRKQRRQVRLAENKSRRDLGKLFLLSMVLKKEVMNLTPVLWDLPRTDITRTSLLWYNYFNRGVFLSAGGAEESFIKMSSVSQNRNLMSFNNYRSDRSESVVVTEADMKNFLVEENALSPATNLNELTLSFCLGSHEGAIRLARCIYQINKNDGIFCLMGSYGFLATSVAVMRPIPYKVRLVNIDRANGEKLSLSDFEAQIMKFPTTKTLFLELKTTCGAIYTNDEIKKIVALCKKHDIFLIFDAAHINMHYYEESAFPHVVSICQESNYHNFAVIYTGSKTFGLERARIGFVVSSKKNKIPDFWTRMEIDFYRVHGSMGDTPFEVMRLLFDSPLSERKAFLVNNVRRLHFNMNLMIAYIEGIESSKIDESLRESVIAEILPEYRGGMDGVFVVYKPKGGVQLKANVSGLQHKYFANIRMSSSEIFGYVLNKMAGVVILNSYQILDSEGFGMRLAYSNKDDVHRGMKAMHEFIKSLSNNPSFNRFLSEYLTLEEMLIGYKMRKKQLAVENSRSKSSLWDSALFSAYKRNVLSRVPRHVRLSDKELEHAVNNAAKTIQRKWRVYSKLKSKGHEPKEESRRFKAKL